MHRRTKALTGVAVLVLIASLWAANDYLRAAAFVAQASGMAGPARTAARLQTNAFDEGPVTIAWRGGYLRGRLYLPRGGSDRAILLLPGLHPAGIAEPRLVQFARDLAAVRHRVLTAELTDLTQYRITPRTTDMIEDAAMWLSRQSGLAPDGRVGMMGISFAGGLSIVAAARPALRDRVAFVMSFGGHGDLPRTLRYLCTGIQPNGEYRPPHDYGVAVIVLNLAERVVPADQVAPLRKAILTFLEASTLDMVDKEKSRVTFERARTLAAALSEPARTVMHYVNERDVPRLGPLLLPHVAEIGDDTVVSPAKSHPPICPVYLLHGADDNVIPAIESSLLAQTLREKGGTVRQLATPLITHAEVDKSAGLRAMWDLVSFWEHLFDR